MTNEFDIERRQLTIQHERQNKVDKMQGEMLKNNLITGFADNGINQSSSVVTQEIARIDASVAAGMDYEEEMYRSSILKSRLHEQSVFFGNMASIVGQVVKLFNPASAIGQGVVNALTGGKKK